MQRFVTRLVIVAAAAAVPTLIAPATAPAAARDECATTGAVGLAYAVGVNCRTVTLDGHPRRFIVYVPATAPVARPHKPVVFMFHGTGGDGEQFLRISGWREQADAAGHIAVFPNGLRYRVLESGLLKSKWNDFNLVDQIDRSELPPGSAPGSPVPADDVGFVDEIVADLQAQLAIDRHRVYASGFSNGARFAARLSVDRSTRIAAAAYSGGGLPSVQSPARPVPTYVTVGTLDAKVLETTDPPVTELPLDPLEILTNPTIDEFLDIALETQGLDEDSFGVVSQPHSTKIPGLRAAPDLVGRCSGSGCSRTSRTGTPAGTTTRTASRPRPSSGSSSRPTRCPDARSALRLRRQV
jgi:poly(3-hydroxybutyrate) depolymerase